MKNRFVFIAGIVFLAGAGLFGFLAVRNYFLSQPAVHLLAAAQKQIYVGDVFQGHTEGETLVYNHSDKPVIISDVITNCRCSEVSVSREPILPGEKTTVKCRWDTTGLRGDTSSEFLLLFYKEGETKLYSLPMSVRGNILPKFDIVPDKLEFLKKSPQVQKT
ncbi:MAG: DUF1573 domain-containing protein [Planctomycetaceae bacterium]|jgi:hypothetical protein|nr:DUF1573 domain-containing protein [Planctomycetaceae bacterium]